MPTISPAAGRPYSGRYSNFRTAGLEARGPYHALGIAALAQDGGDVVLVDLHVDARPLLLQDHRGA